MILDKIIAVVKKDFLSATRYRSGLLVSTVAPAIQIASLYYLARSVGPQFRPEGMPYFVFLLVGTGFFTFLLSGMHSFLRIVQDAQQGGTMEVLMTTNTTPASLLLLSAISAFATSTLQLVLYVGAGLAMFRPAMHFDLLHSVVVFGLSVAIATTIGVFAAALQVSMYKGSAVLWAFGSSASLLAGTIFPVAVLPRPVQMLSQFLPLTHSLAAMRLALIEPHNSALLGREIAILFGFSLVLVPLSLTLFTWTVRRARQSGTLSFY